MPSSTICDRVKRLIEKKIIQNYVVLPIDDFILTFYVGVHALVIPPLLLVYFRVNEPTVIES